MTHLKTLAAGTVLGVGLTLGTTLLAQGGGAADGGMKMGMMEQMSSMMEQCQKMMAQFNNDAPAEQGANANRGGSCC